MNPQLLFLKYAFPCAFVARQRKEITQEEHDLLEKMACEKIPVDIKLVERVFFRAVERMKKNADEKNIPHWSESCVRAYFVDNHNELIETNQYMYGKAPLALKELCKVQLGKIIEKKNDEYALVQFENGKTRPIHLQLVPRVKDNDRVYVHYSYACEVSRAK